MHLVQHDEDADDDNDDNDDADHVKMLSDRNRVLATLLIPESSAGINTISRLDRGSPTPPVRNHPLQTPSQI